MRVLFAAGGTGGTVLPGIVVAQALRALSPETQILFVGTARGFESTLVPKAGFPLELMNIAGLKRKGFDERIRNLLLLPVALWKSWKLLSRFSPTAVFGTGGYASGPILLVASFRRIRTAILEPNSVPGFANRILGKFVDRIFVAFEEAVGTLPKRKCVFSGNPIRKEILDVAAPSFGGEGQTVLIFGGSQGARKLNDAMIGALEELKSDLSHVAFIHQTGTVDEFRVREAYQKQGFKAEVFPFLDDMASLYARADIVIARSGSSVLEIAAVGRPSILVPYPFSADAHQEMNAKIMERAGASIQIDDNDCNGPHIAKALRALLKDRNRLILMSERALTLRKADAADRISRDLLSGRDA